MPDLPFPPAATLAAIAGLGGALIGGLASFAGTFYAQRQATRIDRDRDDRRFAAEHHELLRDALIKLRHSARKIEREYPQQMTGAEESDWRSRAQRRQALIDELYSAEFETRINSDSDTYTGHVERIVFRAFSIRILEYELPDESPANREKIDQAKSDLRDSVRALEDAATAQLRRLEPTTYFPRP